MKKYFLYGILSVMGIILSAPSACAGQYYKPKSSRMGVWTDLGADVWMMSKSELKTSFGGGLGLGMVYEFQQGNFLFNVGFGTNVLYNPVKISNLNVVLPNQDDLDPLYYGGAGEKLDYYYYMTNRQDKYLNMNLQVPVMLGFVSNRFFMLAGVKLGYIINLQTFCTSTMETKGYNSTIGWMQNMPMYQFYPERTKSAQTRCTFRPDVAVSFEIGGYVGEMVQGTGYNRFRKPKHFRISAFVDYGLLSINNTSSTAPIVVPSKYVPVKVYDMVDAASYKDAVSSSVAGAVNNLFVGVKFTALFDLPEPRNCVMCNSEHRFVPRRTKTRM